MDLLAYLIVLIIMSMLKLSKEAEGNLLGSPLQGVVQECTLPVGSNMQMYKEPNAYTAILKELGLMG